MNRRDALLVEWGERDVLTLTLNRPERRNALDPDLLRALAGALDEHGERAGAVILRGAGDAAFSAGYDLGHLTGTPSDLDADGIIGDAANALRRCPAPVIARLHGHCHGAGVEIALSCDLRIATPALRLSVPAIGLGVVYRYQFIARLVQTCGLARASDLLLGMRELDGPEAHLWGLATEVVPEMEIDDRVREVAERLAAAPGPAVRGTKASLNLLAARGLTPEDTAAAQRLRARAAASPERQEALRSRQKKAGEPRADAGRRAGMEETR
jgi:enoyl-CoA hydratase/carnithine racemase